MKKGWLVGMITFDYQGGTALVAKTRSFDPTGKGVQNAHADACLHSLARKLLDEVARLRLFRVRLLG